MAQIGCYVPASKADIGLIDKVFSRVGASDYLSKGQSTFMVEMSETAYILNNATEKSLVILDEIGRGTSTFDGLSIAWATLEHLHDKIGCKTLFATHYHELTTLAEKLKTAKNYTLETQEWKDEVIFKHKVKEGYAGQSYGIYVAKIAGMPRELIKKANKILQQLNNSNKGNSTEILSSDLPLFESPPSPQKEKAETVISKNKNHEEIYDLIEKTDLNSTTPMDALNLLNELKTKL